MEEYQQVTADYMAATAANPAFEVTPELVSEVFSKRIGYQELNHIIGQAASSRQAVFLYGGAGNGKTDLSFQIVHLLPPVLLPYAVEFNRQIIKIFDSPSTGRWRASPDSRDSTPAGWFARLRWSPSPGR